jgi:prevent-host-death family protein
MSVPAYLVEPSHVDEPRAVEDYAAVLSGVATDHRPVIVRRNGEDLAAVIPLEHLELLQEVLKRPEVEKLAAQIDWDRAVQTLRPPQEWFEGDEPKPF